MATVSKTIRDEASEMELLEFILGEQSFGVSVLKVEAIEQYDASKITHIPTLPAWVPGTILFRNRTIPLVDLAVDLGIDTSHRAELDAAEETTDGRVVLVVDFNQTTVAFLADGVQRIHRVQLTDINPLDTLLDVDESKFTGSFNIEGHEILIVDMEKLVGQVVPSAIGVDAVDATIEHPQQDLRPDVKIIIAEDSGTTRAMMKDVLSKGNYTNVTTFRNGQTAYEAIVALKSKAESQGKDIRELLNLVISDIEMPQMDGLSLCKAIKKDMGLSVPVILFSTLTNQEMSASREQVGADAFISKPQIVQLVEMADELTLPALAAQA
jgi:two-component system chemotaxis response regulator CheV